MAQDSIDCVMTKLRNRGENPLELRMALSGTVLESTKTLEFYGIQRNFVITFVQDEELAGRQKTLVSKVKALLTELVDEFEELSEDVRDWACYGGEATTPEAIAWDARLDVAAASVRQWLDESQMQADELLQMSTEGHHLLAGQGHDEYGYLDLLVSRVMHAMRAEGAAA